MNFQEIEKLLGEDGQALLKHECKTISKDLLHLPGPDFIDRVFMDTDRSPSVLRNLQSLFNTGRLSKTGFVSILPVDQGIEHSAGASFAKTRSTLIRQTSSSWPSKADVMRWLQRWACWVLAPANTRTKFPSSSKSTTTNF